MDPMDTKPDGDDSESDHFSDHGSPDQHHPHGSTAPHRVAKLERDKRTYRACLHCRQRKSRCDLYSSGEPGRPPCERCIREQHECILGGSRRGGRRVKRTTTDSSTAAPGYLPSPGISNVLRQEGAYNSGPQTGSPDVRTPTQTLPSWNTLNQETRNLPPISNDGQIVETANMRVDDSVASTDLQNPADALEFLAHVAERDSGSHQLPPMNSSKYGSAPRPQRLMSGDRLGPPSSTGAAIDYPPLVKGQMSLQMIHVLLLRYQEKYHPYYPLANPAAMDPRNLPTTAVEEKHLLAAILTVASKDEKEWWQVHDDCSAHMQSLVASLVYSGCGSVEAVEAMLILAEWVPRIPGSSSQPAIGRGEEDQAAWMYVGTAIRLGYLLGIDRTGFRVDREAQTADLNRKRLAWASCYMSDRQISVRIGKAFWSRGPGPMTSLDARDFPSLRSTSDDFAAIFEANLALTQLFSNAHDVLYATKTRSNQLNTGGEYVKYIDDFRVSLRHWNERWGVMPCSEPLKASLVLSYEYLRLYVNAFAYQATLNRLLAQMQQQQQQSGSSSTLPTNKSTGGPASFLEVAYAPDARFIYDSVDAARTLLSTFCSLVHPEETFRFMPLRYYLYVIYSAVFMYKARSTGIMGSSDRSAVRELIPKTMENLQRSSACPNDVGERYAKLLRLLWSRRPGRGSVIDPTDILQAVRNSGMGPNSGNGSGMNSNDNGNGGTPDMSSSTNPMARSSDFPDGNDPAPPSINTFSWLDLGAVGDYAIENRGPLTGNLLDNLDRFDDLSSADGLSTTTTFDMFNLQPQYALNPGAGGGSGNAWSPSGIIF